MGKGEARRRKRSRKAKWNRFDAGPKRYGCTPPPCRTLADMSRREIRSIEREYGCRVLPVEMR